MSDRYHLTRNNRPSFPISVTPRCLVGSRAHKLFCLCPRAGLTLFGPVSASSYASDASVTKSYTHFLPLTSRGSSALAFSHLSGEGPVRYPPQIPSKQALSYCALGGLPTDSLAYGSLSYEDTTHAPVREFLLATSSHSLTFADAAPSDHLHSSTNTYISCHLRPLFDTGGIVPDGRSSPDWRSCQSWAASLGDL